MTSLSSIHTWATHPMGKFARISIAVGGLTLATLLLTIAAVANSGAWVLVILGVGLAAISMRAARVPTTPRLVLLTVAVIAAPIALRIFI